MSELRIRHQLQPQYAARHAVLVAQSAIVQPTMTLPPSVFRAIVGERGESGDQSEFDTDLSLLYAIAKL